MVGGLLSDVSTSPSIDSVGAPGVIGAFALVLAASFPFYKAWQQGRKEEREARVAAAATDAELARLKDRIRRLERMLRKRERVSDDD